MKKNLFLSLVVILSVNLSCIERQEDIATKSLNNEQYIQKELAGKWKFWGRFSIERNNWIQATPEQSFMYDFKIDNTYTYKDSEKGSVVSGNYKIIPAAENSNPYILLYNNTSEAVDKKILIISLDNEFISIFEHPNEDRYKKH